MNDFLKKHEASITGTISVTDRLILKGYLPMSYPEAAERFFALRGILLKEFKDFTKAQTETLKVHAQAMAKKENRPYEYLNGYVRKEEYVRKIAERDGITEGLICVLAMNEENHTFTLRYGEGRPRLKKSSPRCLTLYFYYLDRHFGFMHVRVSTWLPFSIQVYVNGHDLWLSRLACQTTDNQRCLVPAGGKRLCFHRGLRKSAGRRRPFSDIAMGEDSACLCSSCQSFVQDDTQGDGILLGH